MENGLTEKTEIRDTAYGGWGVGTIPDGRVIFIPHTVEGDVVRYEITEDKSNFVYGRVTDILEASPLRGELYCPHIGACGGCVYGHISPENQMMIKKRSVLAAFERSRVELPEIETSQADFREFRNRATFRIRGGRIGFFRFKSNDFVQTDECPVIKGAIVEKARELAADTSENTSLYVTENEKGEALGRTEAAVKGKYGFAGLKSGKDISGARNIAFDTDYGQFYADFSSFLQGNRHLSGGLQDFVHRNAAGERGLELYSGAGFLTLAFADVCGRIDASESFTPSVRLAEKTGLDNVKWHAGPSERLIGRMKSRYDVIVADPPRTGMDKSVCRFIKDSGAEKVVYISCDPNTMARDIARLSENYAVSELSVYDMFPGSYHAECLALLNKV